MTETNSATPQETTTEARLFRTLVLDDDQVDRARLKTFATRAGLNLAIDEAASIDEMQALLDRGAYDLVFLDYHLDGETGLDALRVVNTHEGQARALKIMVTGYSDTGTIVTAMREGCSDYLVKEEMSVDALRKAVTTALERQIMRAALSEAEAQRDVMRNTLKRFAHSSGPEMRRILSKMLRKVRAIKVHTADDLVIRHDVMAVEHSCGELFHFLEDLTKIVAKAEAMQTPLLTHVD